MLQLGALIRVYYRHQTAVNNCLGLAGTLCSYLYLDEHTHSNLHGMASFWYPTRSHLPPYPLPPAYTA